MSVTYTMIVILGIVIGLIVGAAVFASTQKQADGESKSDFYAKSVKYTAGGALAGLIAGLIVVFFVRRNVNAEKRYLVVGGGLKY